MVVSRSAEKEKAAPNYEAALAAARVGLAEIDIPLQARRLGGVVEHCRDGGQAVSLPCMGKTYQVDLSDGAVSREDGAAVGVFTQILILHALSSHTGLVPSGDWIAFSDIPDGLLYKGVYERRTEHRLARALSGAGGSLAAATACLGGGPSVLGGDASAVVEPFFGVPVGIVFWEGDDQFTPAVTFLYDKTITGILPAEDIVILTQWLADEIIVRLREAAR